MGNKTDFNLDTANLMAEVCRQASLYDYYGEQAVNARDARDRTLNKLDQRTAEVELAIRKAAADSGTKLTEGAIHSQVECDPELIQLRDEVVTANKNLGILDTAVRALDHKKSMIEVASRLTLNSLFRADPDQLADTATDSIRDHLNGGTK